MSPDRPLTVRPPHFAGRYYFADEGRLLSLVMSLVEDAQPARVPGAIRALIVPHGPHLDAGPVAGFAYKLLLTAPQVWDRVTLLAPTAADAALPLIDPRDAYDVVTGLAGVDIDARAALLRSGLAVARADDEPVLESHLQFVLMSLGDVPVLPLRLGAKARAASVTGLPLDPGLIIAVANLPSAGAADAIARLDERLLAETAPRSGGLAGAFARRARRATGSPDAAPSPDSAVIACALAWARARGATESWRLKVDRSFAAFALTGP